jgi:hypothetical protein
MLRVGPESRWWNRKIKFPIKPILITGGLLLGIGLAYEYFGSVVESCVWSLAHRSTATYRGWAGSTYEGFSVKVPWMWMQKEYPAGQATISLVRVRVGETVPLESMFISKDASPGMSLRTMESLAQKFQETGDKTGLPDFGMRPFPIDSNIASRFSCMAPHIGKRTIYMVQCASIDKGRWSVVYFKPSIHDAADLNTVLRKLASSP